MNKHLSENLSCPPWKIEGRTVINNSRGSATLLTLLISAVIITVGIGFNWLVKEHLKAAEGLKNKTEAMLKARSVFNSLIYSILTGNANSKEVVFAEGQGAVGLKAIPLNGAAVAAFEDIDIKIQDSNGMLSLANLFTPALERLIRAVQPENKMTPAIIDSFFDWIDRDDLARINGAEDSFYRTEGKPYTARNYPMQYKEEFSLIRGMNEDLYKKISPYLTLLPNFGFNPNTAGDEALKAYLDLDGDTLAALRNYMTKKPITSNLEMLALTGRTIPSFGESSDFVPSKFWEITINAGKPKPVYSVQAGLDLRQSPRFPYTVIYWKEE